MLTDQDIKTLAKDYFFAAGRPDDVARFLRTLADCYDARELARTSVTLCNALLCCERALPAPLRAPRDEVRAVPDGRHRIYRRVVEVLMGLALEPEALSRLTVSPRAVREGVVDAWRAERDTGFQWRPDDIDERFRQAAALALAVQEEGYRGHEGEGGWAVVLTFETMMALLPQSWPRRHREGFLTWLAGPAGLLADRGDGMLQFAHMGLQSYLSAWRLNVTTDSPESRIAAFCAHLDRPWWDTLAQWAAIIYDTNPPRIAHTLQALPPLPPLLESHLRLFR